MTNHQKAILIQLHIGRLTFKELEFYTGFDTATLAAALQALEAAGQIHQPHPGLYAIQETADYPTEATTL